MDTDNKVYEILGCIRTILDKQQLNSYELYSKVSSIVAGLDAANFNRALRMYGDVDLIQIDPHIYSIFKVINNAGIVVSDEWIHDTFHKSMGVLLDNKVCAEFEKATILLDRQLVIRKDGSNNDDYLDGFQACINELKAIKNEEVDQSKDDPWDYI
jgi:hypothetical protein